MTRAIVLQEGAEDKAGAVFKAWRLLGY